MKIGNYYASSNRLVRFILYIIDVFFKNNKQYVGIDSIDQPKILIVRIEHLGDVISTLSLVNCIEQLSSRAVIDLLIADHSEMLKPVLSGFTNIYSIPTTIFHDRSKYSLHHKIFKTIKSYFLGFRLISKNKYDCIIFGSHHFFGFQLLGIFAKHSLAYSSSGFSFIHSKYLPITSNSQIEERTKIMSAALYPNNFSKLVNYSYKKIKIKSGPNLLGNDYVLLTMGSGDVNKDLEITDILFLYKSYSFLNNINEIYLVGDLPNQITLDNLYKLLPIKIKYLGRKIEINKLLNLIKYSKAIISADTFLAHLSSAISSEIPIYIIYKNNIGLNQWRPPGPNVNQIRSI